METQSDSMTSSVTSHHITVCYVTLTRPQMFTNGLNREPPLADFLFLPLLIHWRYTRWSVSLDACYTTEEFYLPGV